MASPYSAVGFIGLGTMGIPMVENLTKKLPSSTKIYVYDVSEQALKKIEAENKGKVHACSNSKEVAENSVCTSSASKFSFTRNVLRISQGYHPNYGSRRITC
jgi:3-hydroxyisobutyrate dehydrogenase-like beta-hydroxyacid dehydrogenase